jgi:hypothetical protein
MMSEDHNHDERSRVIRQMHGEVTYQQSAKEKTLAEMGDTAAKTLQAIQNIGKSTKKKKRKKSDFDRTREAKEDDKYLESVNTPTDYVYNANSVWVREKAEKTRFDQELEEIEARDPHNWTITSVNRQRQMYSAMYYEHDCRGDGTMNPEDIINSKLKTFTPGMIPFPDYLNSLRQEKIDATNERIRKASEIAFEEENNRGMEAEDDRLSLLEEMTASLHLDIVVQDIAEPLEHRMLKSTARKAETAVGISGIEAWDRWPNQLRAPLYRSKSRKVYPKSITGAGDEVNIVETPFVITSSEIRQVASPIEIAAPKKMQPVSVDVKQRERVSANFEDRLDTMEKLYRKTVRSNKRSKKKMSQKTTNPKPISAAQQEISLDLVKRHTYSNMLLKTKSLPNLDDVRKKTAKAESRWVKKVCKSLKMRDFGDSLLIDRTLSRNPEESSIPVFDIASEVHRRILTKARNKSDLVKKSEVKEDPATLAKKVLQEYESKRKEVKAQKNFGTYSKRELLRFWKLWLSLEKTRRDGRSLDEETLSVDLHRDDDSIKTEDLDEFQQALKFLRDEEERIQFMANEEVVSLYNTIDHEFVQLTPHFKDALEEVRLDAIAKNIPIMSVRLSLNDLLTYLCPIMDPGSRAEGIRMFDTLPKPVEKPKEVAPLPEEEVIRLRIMFDYMDADGSGYVDVEELCEALTNEQDRMQAEIERRQEASALSGEEGVYIAPKKWTEEEIIRMVQGVDTDGNMELDFGEFVQLFRDQPDD